MEFEKKNDKEGSWMMLAKPAEDSKPTQDKEGALTETTGTRHD